MLEPILLDREDCGRLRPGWERVGSIARWISTSPPMGAMPRDWPAMFKRVSMVEGDICARASEHQGSIEIGRGEIHLWCVPLDVPRGALTAMAETLDPGERDRAAGYRFEPRRIHYVAAHGALRRILSAYVGLPPDDIRYRSEAYGRPQLAPEINPGKLDFNLSHSGELAIVAVAGDGRVGVDVEELRDFPLEHELAEQTLSAGEWSEWCQYPPEARTRAFLRWWTRKEACLKADGRGLRRDPRQVSVGSGSNSGLLWSRVTAYGLRQPGWAVCSLEVIPGYLASVAVAE